MRAKILDTTRDRDYGEVRTGDVLELDDATFQRFKAIGLAETTDEFPHRAVAADPRFASPDRTEPVYDAAITRDSVGAFVGGTPPGVEHPSNVAPEVAFKMHQLEVENARLRAQLEGTPEPDQGTNGAAPVDDLTDAQKQKLIDAGLDDRAKIAAASDDDLAKAGLTKAAIAKLRG